MTASFYGPGSGKRTSIPRFSQSVEYKSYPIDFPSKWLNRTNFLHERGVEITKAIRCRRVEAALELHVVVIAQALGKVVETGCASALEHPQPGVL